MLLPTIDVDDTLRDSFEQFRQDPLNVFRVNVRRKRVEQLRQLLSNPHAIDLDTFRREVWTFETRTYLHSRKLEFFIFKGGNLLQPAIGDLLQQEKITFPELEAALASGDLELHGNYMWGQATNLYAPKLKDEQEKLQYIQMVLQILNDKTHSPLQKVREINALHGFGEANATALVMIFHPDEFVLTNAASKDILKKLGLNITPSTPLETIQQELHALKETLHAQDFLELDWFLYQCNQNRYPIGALDKSISEKTGGMWVSSVKQVLEDAGKPLHITEITAQVLASDFPTKGKTPDRTVSWALTTHPQLFERISEGVYRLRQTLPESEEAIQSVTSDAIAESSRVEEYVEPAFDDIVRSILGQGMRLDERMIRRYHLALKTRGFVMLSGPSGTGKTWLTEAYASAVGATYLIVPVAPNWTTNEDLLGYVDPLNHNVYHHTVFSYFLEKAAQEYEQALRDKCTPRPYHLILDEMNLARVEYYFAKFLSTMEIRARQGVAVIDLGAGKQINLYRNLSFIGTINVDETTHGFADKVYDRAQLIEMPISREALQAQLVQEPYGELLMQIWDALHEIAPFAFRILAEFSVYVRTAQEIGVSWEEAVDEQMMQKILPKCKGIDPKVGLALERLKILLPEDSYPLSHQKIVRMTEGFRVHGIVSYF